MNIKKLILVSLLCLSSLGLVAQETSSSFAVINVIRVEKPRNNARLVYFDVEGENGGSVDIQCNSSDSSTVFWQRVQVELTAIANKYYPGREYQFAGVSFPNPDKLVTIARQKVNP